MSGFTVKICEIKKENTTFFPGTMYVQEDLMNSLHSMSAKNWKNTYIKLVS